MQTRKFYLYLPMSILLMLGIFLLWPTPPAEAQCGSQASSCKNCHEVQGEMPVNNDGTDWHESHAFGDFCEFCHAGNVQATDAAGAHTGMVPPLSDVEAGCSSCHPDDLMDKANVYAATLGVTVGEGGDTSGGSTDAAAPADSGSTTSSETSTTVSSSSSSVPASTEMIVNDPNTIDYVQRYDEVVLGITPKNWGNIALVALIAIVIVAGGMLVIKNEHLLGGDETAVTGTYPADAVAMLPNISEMNGSGRKALDNILQKPKEASKLFQSVSNLNE